MEIFATQTVDGFFSNLKWSVSLELSGRNGLNVSLTVRGVGVQTSP